MLGEGSNCKSYGSSGLKTMNSLCRQHARRSLRLLKQRCTRLRSKSVSRLVDDGALKKNSAGSPPPPLRLTFYLGHPRAQTGLAGLGSPVVCADAVCSYLGERGPEDSDAMAGCRASTWQIAFVGDTSPAAVLVCSGKKQLLSKADDVNLSVVILTL